MSVSESVNDDPSTLSQVDYKLYFAGVVSLAIFYTKINPKNFVRLLLYLLSVLMYDCNNNHSNYYFYYVEGVGY